MAMGRRNAKQQELFIATTQLARSPENPFYEKLNKPLAEVGFDTWLESRCQSYYENEQTRGRDSFSLRTFLGIGPTEESPDRTSLGKAKKRLPLELFEEVFQFVLKMASEKKLLSGKTVGVDSTTLEANVAMFTQKS